MNTLNIVIPDPEPKEVFSLKLRPSIKQLLVDLCKKTKVGQEDVLKAGIHYVEKEFNKKKKKAEKKNDYQDNLKPDKTIINPYPKLVKRTKKEPLNNLNESSIL